MPVYRITIKGRRKPILTKAETAAKARDSVVDAVALTAEEMADALSDGEKLWTAGDELPADEPDPAESGPGDQPKAEAKDASEPVIEVKDKAPVDNLVDAAPKKEAK